MAASQNNKNERFQMPALASAARRQILAEDEIPFDRMASLFEEAAAGGHDELRLNVAGHPVRLRIAGSRWATIVRQAMGHLIDPEGHAGSVGRPRSQGHEATGWSAASELRIDAWDAAETGVPMMPAAQSELSAPPILMRTSTDGAQVGEERPHSLVWMDRNERRIVGCVSDTGLLNLDERARPFHKLISAWLEDHSVQVVHSGLIECNNKGILFVGNGGAGKSTSSIACLRAGMRYLGDDFIGLGLESDQFVGYGLYATCLLNVHHIERFPDLRPLGHAPNHASEDKFVLYLQRSFPQSLQRQVHIHALVLPRVVDRDFAVLRPASRMAALKAIAPTSVMYLPRPNRTAFERLAMLVEKTPCFWLELGRNIDSIPAVVRGLADSI
jgi:hypothetical protein